MDYKKKMDAEKFNFFEFYENVMDKLENDFHIPDELKKELKEKRKFGYEKYGEYSFQANFQNAMTTPTEEHLREEFVDAINYALHNLYKRSVMMKDYSKQVETTGKIIELYKEIEYVFPS